MVLAYCFHAMSRIEAGTMPGIHSPLDTMRLTRLTDRDESALEVVSAHESGHEICARQFGKNPESYVTGRDSGACRHEPGSDWESAVISWGGVVGEYLLGHIRPDRAQIMLDAEHFDEWYEMMRLRGGLDRVSGQDRDGIYGHPNARAAARTAFQLLTDKRPWLEAAFECFVDKSRERLRALEQNRKP